MSIRINQHTFQTQPQPTVPKQTEKFEETLTSTELKVSNHARKRLEQRGYSLAQQDMTTLNTAVNELEEKGSEQSLLLYKDLALIASVRNRTIITALNPDELDTVTNIDSTKFVRELKGLDRKETQFTDRLM
ncbi:flagellar protein [Jeotgalibaca porci]|uniref:flagellar protein n=1 Tax=Jeotgalibaca porci TaxID=1868793 RepID=UPI0035A0570A